MKEAMWLALFEAQHGGVGSQVSRMHGDLREVMEIVVADRSGTYRGTYYIGRDRVYALYFFKKKSKRGIATPKENRGLIRARLAAARRSEGKTHRK